MVTWRGLVRYLVVFVIDLETRRVEIAGISSPPDGIWVTQMARNLTDCEDGLLLGCRYLLHDRDPLFTQAFRATLKSSGVYPVKLPSRSPNMNAYAERFVRSIKSECTAQVIPLGECHLRRAPPLSGRDTRFKPRANDGHSLGPSPALSSDPARRSATAEGRCRADHPPTSKRSSAARSGTAAPCRHAPPGPESRLSGWT